MIDDVVGLCVGASAVVGGARWVRIAQREHYLPGSVSRFAARWWRVSALNLALAAVGVAAVVLAGLGRWEAAIAAGVIGLAAPVGLSYRGRGSKLAWTRRGRTVAIVAATLAAVVTALGVWVWHGPLVTASAVALLAPVIVDVALGALAPLERRGSERFVTQARKRIDDVSPRVVAITGSFGKTSTKLLVGHLLGETFATVTSPASFNNRLGLARAVNERLAPGTEVFVAEMGTYGVGEIRALCAWLPPEVGVMTAIGPVHLERMGSLDTIVKAKSEILERAKVGVLNVDATGLAALADEREAAGLEVLRVSGRDAAADVFVERDSDAGQTVVHLRGREIARVPADAAFPENLGCAVAVAVAMGVPDNVIATALSSAGDALPRAEHRQTVGTTGSGVTVIDDTYNSNPTGAAAALRTLASFAAARRRVVVTPGMVEMGREQKAANAEFARQASKIATDLLIVGHTNRAALVAGARDGTAGVRCFGTRERAVAWVRSELDEGDAVLYENDLPDHYP